MRNQLACLQKVRLSERSRHLLSGAALILAGCVRPNSLEIANINALDQPLTARDTVSRPLEIFNDGGSGLNAIRAVIQTSGELDRVWEVLRRNKSEPAPHVDFSRDMLVIAGMGWQPEAGYRIRISSVRDTARLLEITVDLAISTADCTKAGYATIDHPVVIVRVPRSQSTAVFQDRVHRSC